jgi:hypothetical protein
MSVLSGRDCSNYDDADQKIASVMSITDFPVVLKKDLNTVAPIQKDRSAVLNAKIHA